MCFKNCEISLHIVIDPTWLVPLIGSREICFFWDILCEKVKTWKGESRVFESNYFKIHVKRENVPFRLTHGLLMCMIDKTKQINFNPV